MNVRPVHAVPISYFRSNTKQCMSFVSELNHVLLTSYGNPIACVIPHRDARVLWQLQQRPLKEMKDRLRNTYANWLRAKAIDEEWTGVILDETPHWEDWAGFEKM